MKKSIIEFSVGVAVVACLPLWVPILIGVVIVGCFVALGETILEEVGKWNNGKE